MLFHGLQSTPLSENCPACSGDNQTIQFDWQVLKAGLPKMLPIQKLKAGSILQCSVCRQYWYLGEPQDKITLVPQERVATLKTWGTTALSLSPALFQKAKAIGATPVHTQARHSQYAEIPCRVKISPSEWIDKGLLVFTDIPPLEPNFGGVHLLNEVLDIEPSPYALPAKVRLATCRSKPDSEGKAPTYVETEEGKLLSLNWTVNFVDYKKIKGSELRLASQMDPASLRKKKLGKIALLQEPILAATLFMGHWSKDILDLKLS